MPPVRMTRAEQQAQTRERLLTAAERVIARCGYGGASIDLISAEAGYSKGAVYSNFESKEAMFLEVLGRHMDRNMADLADQMDVGSDQISDAVAAWLETISADADCIMVAVELQLHARRNPIFAERYYALQKKNSQALAVLLARYFAAQGAPMPLSAADLADTLIAISHGVSLQRPLPPSGEPGTASEIIDVVLRRLAGTRGSDASTT